MYDMGVNNLEIISMTIQCENTALATQHNTYNFDKCLQKSNNIHGYLYLCTNKCRSSCLTYTHRPIYLLLYNITSHNMYLPTILIVQVCIVCTMAFMRCRHDKRGKMIYILTIVYSSIVFRSVNSVFKYIVHTLNYNDS